MKVMWAGLLLWIGFGSVTPVSQAPPDDDGKAILDALTARKISEPQLGWLLPNGELVTEVASSEITFLGEGMAPKVAPRIGVVSAGNVLTYVKKNQVDCDQLDEDNPVPLYRYDAKMPKSKVASQVFVTAGHEALALNVGFTDYKATEVELDPVWREMHAKP